MSVTEEPLVVVLTDFDPVAVPNFRAGADVTVIAHADGRLEFRFFGDTKRLIQVAAADSGRSLPEVIEAVLWLGLRALEGQGGPTLEAL